MDEAGSRDLTELPSTSLFFLQTFQQIRHEPNLSTNKKNSAKHRFSLRTVIRATMSHKSLQPPPMAPKSNSDADMKRWRSQSHLR